MNLSVRNLRWLPLLAVALLTFVSPSVAATVKEIVRDMAPVEGHVLMLSEGEYLVDLDASHRVTVGDLLALVEPGEKITHPVSGEVIGQLTAVKGYLEVTRVASGFSYAVSVSGKVPERGDKVRRFEGVTAYFQESGAMAGRLGQHLREKLGQFKWRPLPPGGKAPVEKDNRLATLFQMEGAKLQVTTLAGKSLRTFLVDDQGVNVGTESAVPKVPKEKQLVFPDGTNTMPKGIVKVRKARRADEYWRTGMLEGSPAGMVVGQFAKGQRAVALAMTGKVILHPLPFAESLGTGIEVQAPGSIIPIKVAAYDLDKDGLDELYVSARRADHVASYVVDFSSGKGKVTHENLSWLFNRIETGPGQWVLAAQQAGGILAGGAEAVFRVSEINAKGVQLAGALKKPLKANLFSYRLYQGEEGLFTANFNSDDQLELYNPSGTLRWRSDDRLGGSDAYLLTRKNNDDEYNYLPAPMRQSPAGELLVPMNLGQTLFRIRSYKSSHVKAMRMEGGELVEVWRTKKQNGYLSDFQVVDFDGDGKPNLLLAVRFGASNILSEGKYALVGYELPENVQ